MRNHSIRLFVLLFTTISFAQTNGYWDKERATTKEVRVSAGNRVIISTEELPVGTTEVVYRITLLDENQQLANSLFSVLKAIPDPTGISQGSAGAVLLLSKISGDDQCKYAIFTNKDLAVAYKENGKSDKACLYQDNPVNKDAKRLSLNASTCLKTNVMWFGFESQNWIMNQRIVLEVVPWVDTKLNRGWTIDNRKLVITLCKTTDLAKKIAGSDDYCACVLDKIQAKFRFEEYQNLLAAEKTKAFRDAGNSCYAESVTTIYNDWRTQSTQLTQQGKYAEAITRLEPIFEEGKAKSSDCNAMAVNAIFTHQYEKAIKFLRQGEQLDPSDLQIQLNLAHALLLRGSYGQAKSIYRKYKGQNVTDQLRWTDKVKLDFAAFEKAGLPSKDFDNILRMLD